MKVVIYKDYFAEDKLSFVPNYLQYVPQEKLMVPIMHITCVGCDSKEDMVRLNI